MKWLQHAALRKACGDVGDGFGTTLVSVEKSRIYRGKLS